MPYSDYKRRSPEQQLADLNAAWDRIKTLAATNDRQQQEIQYLKNLVSVEKLKRWAVTGVLVIVWEVGKEFVKFLILHH